MAAKKTPTKTPNRPGKHGGLLLSGNPGNKGGGRPTKAFKDFLASLRDDPEAQDALEAAAKDPTLRSFGSAWQLAASYDENKPAEKRELSGQVDVAVVFERESRRRTAG